MKILMLSAVNIEVKNAPMVHTIEIKNNLEKEGHSIILLVPEVIEHKHYIPKIKYIPFLNIRGLMLITFNFFLYCYIVFYYLKIKPDVMYVRYGVSPISIIISKILRVPCIVEINGIPFDEIKIYNFAHTKRHLLLIISHLTLWISCKFSDKIVAVTEGIKKELCNKYKLPPDKIVIIPNGVNTDLFKPMNKERVKEELNLDKNAQYVCWVGDLAPWQGVEYLIMAAPLILKEIPNTRFLIVGDGVMKKKCIELVKKLNLADKFIFTGAVPYNEVPKYINVSDVCVALKSHLRSGYSALKMYEYLSCGRPIVASNERGLGDVLEKNNAGVSVNREDSKDVADAIVKLIKNEKLRDDMGKNGRKLVVENYSWNAAAKRVAEVCEKLIKCKSSNRK